MDGENRTMWIFEPHVAEKVFEDFVTENKITVYRNEWLNRESGLRKKKGKIVSFNTLSGKKFSGKMFIGIFIRIQSRKHSKLTYLYSK